ncbi:MAG: CoA transferase [Chloroflexi bacterium]|nr:CoA transferase [Chloroflexota bacterium]
MASMGKVPFGALKGVQVVEFGEYLPGPLLGMLLADQGAEVIKVERPGGDPARKEPAFAVWNRGKQSIVLDLKNARDLGRARELSQRADVVIENFRPGVADRLGIAYTALAQSNSGLVYCSLPGFGEESPFRNLKAWDGTVEAVTGTYWRDPEFGRVVSKPGNIKPSFTSVPLAGTYAAMSASAAVVMALIARQRTGKGQRIEVPLHSAMFTAIGTGLTRVLERPQPDYGGGPLAWTGSLVRTYEGADGRWVQVQRSGLSDNEGSLRLFFGAVGHPEWTEEAIADSPNGRSPENSQKWLGRMRDIFKTKAAQEWEDLFDKAGVPCAVCRTMEEWMESEHAIASGMVVEVDDPQYGAMKQPGVQVRLRGTPGAIRGPAPRMGEHTSEILADLRNPRPRAQDTRPSPGPRTNLTSVLQGVRVLDLCIILAGPTCARILAEYGADVIKIDEPSRGLPPDPRNFELNRGKRSILLDLKTAEGLKVFWRLVDTSDVIVENYRQGKLDKLGIGYEDVKKRKPDIIYASMNTFGYDGPWSHRPGWEQLAQACGIQVREGGRGDRPLLMPYAVDDFGTGIMCAYAVALALHERNRTGRGQKVDSALAHTAGLLQSRFMLDFQGFQRKEVEGPEALGLSALSRLYEASDGWLYLACVGQQDWRRLTALRAFASLASVPSFATPEGREAHDKELSNALTDIFAEASVSHWTDQLAQSGISAVKALSVDEFRDDPAVRKAGLVVTREHEGFGKVDHVGSVVRLSMTPMQLGAPNPSKGKDADEILGELGYTKEDIQRLQAARAVVRPGT